MLLLLLLLLLPLLLLITANVLRVGENSNEGRANTRGRKSQ